MSFKTPLFEMHLHTNISSACGKVSPQESLPIYRAGGYDGVVITDHFRKEWFDPTLTTWSQKVACWLRSYREAKQVGDAIGLTVLPGMELRFAGDDQTNEYLIYGWQEGQLDDCADLYDWGEERLSDYTHTHGLFLAQSHPFRDHMTPYDPSRLDGMETDNRSPRWNSRNDLAAAYAAQVGLRPLAGSDFHQRGDLSGAGVRFRCPITDSAALADALFRRAYDLECPALSTCRS